MKLLIISCLLLASTLAQTACPVTYTHYPGKIGARLHMPADDLIPTDPVCNPYVNEWVQPFCRDGKYPQGLEIGIYRCKMACAARPKCGSMGIAHPYAGDHAPCFLYHAYNASDPDFQLITHGGWDYYTIEKDCNTAAPTNVPTNIPTHEPTRKPSKTPFAETFDVLTQVSNYHGDPQQIKYSDITKDKVDRVRVTEPRNKDDFFTAVSVAALDSPKLIQAFAIVGSLATVYGIMSMIRSCVRKDGYTYDDIQDVADL